MQEIALITFVIVVVIGAIAWVQSIKRTTAELRRLRAEQERRDDEARDAARKLTEQPRTCKHCKNFDHELGQREMARQPNFMAAAAAVPPWRMGRVLKTDAAGKTLPLSEQGIDPALMKLEWADFGACVPKESLISPIDTCEKFERREQIIPAAALVR